MKSECDDDAIESEAMLVADADRDDVAIEIKANGDRDDDAVDTEAMLAINEDRDDVAIETEVMLAKAQPLFTKKCCIYRVPHEIRKFMPDEYTPKIVSIGPFHHGDSKLLPMEGHKQIYCLKFIERSEVSLDDLVSCLQELEPEVRQCYTDNIKLSKEKLVRVRLVDCGFIIEIFLRHHFGEWMWTEDDVILLTPRLIIYIRFNLLLLENQLPFFIVEKLYNLAFPSSLNGGHLSFLTFTLDYFNGYTGNYLPSTFRGVHFTDLLRTSHLQPPNRRPTTVPCGLVQLYSATAGVKFMINDTSESFLDLQFSRSYLKMLLIEVEDSTEMLLRNMEALEQFHYPEETYIADYMLLINFLINTAKDVDVLVKNGILVSWLGDNNAVAEMFNGFGKNIANARFNWDYLHIVNELNAYCKHPLHSKMATLKRDYCNTPWRTIASIAGIALLVLTIMQTVFSIIK